jgi:phosphoglycolate phosphatase
MKRLKPAVQTSQLHRAHCVLTSGRYDVPHRHASRSAASTAPWCTTPMTTQLAIFDFDGTLADTWPVFADSLNMQAARHGFREVGPEEVRRLRRLSAGEVISELDLPLWRVPVVLSDFRKIVRGRIGEIRPFADVTEALHMLADRHILLALATSNSIGNVRAVLGPALVGRFAVMECGSSLFGKSQRLRRILKKTRIDRRGAIYVGDEIRDAEAAGRVGVGFGAVAWGYTDVNALLRQNPSGVFRVPADLHEL